MSTIFWDFDGTLVYSHHLWSGSMYDALTAVCPHTTVTFRQIRECNTRGFPWQTPERDHSALIGETWWQYIEAHAYSAYRSCGVNDITSHAAASLLKRFILSPDRYHLFSDTVSVLRTCKHRGHRNVLLSNNFPELETITDALGLMPYLDGVITSALEGFDKPRKELFALAVNRFPDDRHYMIGDNPLADFQGGQAAGMIACLVHADHDPTACHFKELSDILPYIR